jgi:hypothetical protein
MSQLTFKIVSDPLQAKTLWERFSPHKTIDDEWEFRKTYTNDLDLPFHFIVGFENDTPVGLLALQLNTLKGLSPKLLQMTTPYLEFFSGIDTDDNGIFLLPGYEDRVSEFLDQVDRPAVLSSLKEPYTYNGKEAEHYLDRYELDLTKFNDFDDFLQKNFDGISRQRLINRINKIHKTYTVEIKDAKPEDIDLLFTFSITRFGERSSFNMPQRQRIYMDLLKNFDVDLFTIHLNGEPKAIAFCLMHKDSYISVNIGYDYSIRDLSKLLVVTQMRRAMEKGFKRFDAGQGDNGWKEHFHFEKVPQYKLVLP